MLDRPIVSEFFRNVVDFLELGYYSMLDLTSGGKDLDETLKEVNAILDSTSSLLKHHETLLRPEQYAEYTAKHRTRGDCISRDISGSTHSTKPYRLTGVSGQEIASSPRQGSPQSSMRISE
ncbi:hypothetical protein FRC06_002209 [Ceratobasidium sp. 370]|nr:hypothetical protein FRC06_002209 [Ceratobasidium sp. 370]